MQGEGGFNPAPRALLEHIRAVCDQHGIVMIVDEVQTGAGRTGTWYAIEQSGVVPDMITLAKSMAGGFPISAVTGRADIMDAPAPGGLGGTYAGNPISCVAALAVLDAFDQEDLLQRSRSVGRHLVSQLEAIADQHPELADIRGLGAMVAVELCKNGDLQQPAPELAKAVSAEAARRGLILLTCGTYGNVLRILVPLTASDALLDEGLAILAASIEAVKQQA